MNVEQLQTDGFVSVEYPEQLRMCVKHAMRSWQNFCSLPTDKKEQLSGGDRLRDFGYMFRKDTGPRTDQKEIFHVVRNRIAELREKGEGISDKRAVNFINAIDALIGASAPLVQKFARAVARTYGLADFETDVMNSQDNWTFRYIHYFGGETLAHAHADRGGFTLHLHESDAGGEYFGFDNKWHPWPVTDTQTIIFPSMVLQHYSAGALKALWHRVQPTPKTAAHGRYSMVAFIDFAHVLRYNDAAKNLKDFNPGFNYRMPWNEFDALFVPRVPVVT